MTACNRNALLDLRAGAGARATAEHVAGCAECRAYLAGLERVEAGLRDEAMRPRRALRAQVLARAVAEPQVGSPRPLPVKEEPNAAPLLGLVPVMAAAIGAVRVAGDWLRTSPFWEGLNVPVAVEELAPFAAVGALLFVVGGLASLALAPVLLLDAHKR